MSGCGCEDEDGLLSNDFSSCSSKNKSKTNSSTIQYDGNKLICIVDGETKFNIRSCSSLNSVLQTFAQQICLLNNNPTDNFYVSNVELVGTDLIFTNDGSVGSLAFQGNIDLSSLVIAGGAVVSADNGLGIDPANNVQLGGTLLKQTIIDHAGLYDLIFKSATKTLDIFSIMGDSGRVGVWTDNPFTDQVKYASSVDYAFPFVVRTTNDRFGFSHNNGTVELGSYIFNPNAYFGTTTNHGLIWYTNDINRGVITADGNFSFGTINDLSARVGVQGIDSTSSNFALKVQNIVSDIIADFRNDKRVSLGGSWAGNDLLVVDGSNGQIRTNLTGQGFYDSEFLIRSNDTNPVMFHVSKSGGSFSFLVEKDGSDPFRSWVCLVRGDGWSIANDSTTGLAYLNLGGVPRFALIGSDIDVGHVNAPDILHWTDGGSGDVRQVLISSIRGLGYPAPYIDISTGDRATFTCENRINTVGHSYFAVNTGTASDNVGIGTKVPQEKLHSTDKIRTDTVFNVNGTDGFTGTGAYTNFTIVGGIITNAT